MQVRGRQLQTSLLHMLALSLGISDSNVYMATGAAAHNRVKKCPQTYLGAGVANATATGGSCCPQLGFKDGEAALHANAATYCRYLLSRKHAD